MVSAGSAWRFGSSPLARGKHGGHEVRRQRRRLIPARAGKTPSPPSRRARSKAHPRSRGENAHLTRLNEAGTGSSPLARGKLACRSPSHLLPRLIPARAGKTRNNQSANSRGWAHPRSRGENAALTAGTGMKVGSSPLARGKPHGHPVRARRPGLIPARAGKTTPPALSPRLSTAHPRSRGKTPPKAPTESLTPAHPRSRGENRMPVTGYSSSMGSSPLARGKRRRRGRARGARWLIPARAGKTKWTRRNLVDNGAHPRSRGENVAFEHRAQILGGSSPLARGKQTVNRRHCAPLGLIPARAGKTLAERGGSVASTAHPRSRGENTEVRS